MSPRVELSYTYLMAWFLMHYPMLIECPKKAGLPFVQRLEDLNWLHNYFYNVRKILMNPQAYEVFCCLPSIPGASFEDEYVEVSSAKEERLIDRSPDLFLQLVNIQPGYMVFTSTKTSSSNLYAESLWSQTWLRPAIRWQP